MGRRNDTRSRAQVAGCRICVTRDVARYSLKLISWCRSYRLSVYIVFTDPNVPRVEGFDIQHWVSQDDSGIELCGDGVSKPGRPGDLHVPASHGVPLCRMAYWSGPDRRAPVLSRFD